MKLNSFKELFVVLLCDVRFLEKQIVNALPKIISKVESEELREALENHLEETREQVKRTDQVFREVGGGSSMHVEWEGNVKNLFQDADRFLSENAPSPLLDAAIIAICQKIEHLEIAAYGTLKEYSKVIDLPAARKYIEDSLEEEGKADTILTKLAKGNFFKTGINETAVRR